MSTLGLIVCIGPGLGHYIVIKGKGLKITVVFLRI